ncbi:MAG: S24/S26 family peptidase [Oscillospiraceae bacterium]|nr:S24/S26 family peptidase [Oscillospiraceae bacterium]
MLTAPLNFPEAPPRNPGLDALRGSLVLLGSVTLTVTGDSMIPTLHHMKDAVVLAPYTDADWPPKRGQIVYAQRADGSQVMHRVLKAVSGGAILSGDGQVWLEGPIPRERIYAKVIMMRRNGRFIKADSPAVVLYGQVWLALRPLRRILFALVRAVKRI